MCCPNSKIIDHGNLNADQIALDDVLVAHCQPILKIGKCKSSMSDSQMSHPKEATLLSSLRCVKNSLFLQGIPRIYADFVPGDYYCKNSGLLLDILKFALKVGKIPPKTKGMLTEAEQLKIITKRSHKETHSSHASGSGADEGTGVSPGVPDTSYYDSDVLSPGAHVEETDEDDTFDPLDSSPSFCVSSSDDEDSDNEVEGVDVEGEKSDEDATDEEDKGNETDKDTNANLEGRDDVMTDVILPQVQATQEIEDTHVTLTPVNPDGQQQSSSVSSGFVSNMLNPNQDTGVDAIFGQHAEATSLIDIPVTAIAEPSFFAPTKSLKALEDNFSEFKQTNQYAEALSSIPGIVDQYLANKLKYSSNEEVIKEQVKKEVSKITPKIKKLVNEQLESEVLVRSSKEAKTSHAVAANLSELELKKILIDKMEANNLINRPGVQSKREKVKNEPDLPVLQEKRQQRQQERLLQFETEVYKATTEKLDSINPEGRQYPHDLQKPLPLVPNSLEDDDNPYTSSNGKANFHRLGSKTLKTCAFLVQGKFSDGTLDDVRTALNDRLKGIRMEYLPQTFWSQRDKVNARAMIQAIDKRLKTRRIMRSLERFVGGRPYGGDLRLLQRTI
ncbi:hypothetical protein Tco_0455234 [Tanacetum coccineum]